MDDIDHRYRDWADLDGPLPEPVPVVRCATCLQVAPFHWPACPVGAAKIADAALVDEDGLLEPIGSSPAVGVHVRDPVSAPGSHARRGVTTLDEPSSPKASNEASGGLGRLLAAWRRR